MMRSLFSGVSGLRSHQTKMDVIGNNISNINTVGFKAGRVTFNEMLNQKIRGASRSNEESGRGGTNPMQIGLGVNIGAINVLMTEGANQRTDWGLDLKIDGDGFFVVGDSTSNYFTRAGNFTEDELGAIVTSSGLHLMGWPAVESTDKPGTFEIRKGTVEPLSISSMANAYIGAEQTETINFEGNLNPNETSPIKKNMTFYDSLGNKYTLGTTFEYRASSQTWDLKMDTYMIMNGDTTNPIFLDVPEEPEFADGSSNVDAGIIPPQSGDGESDTITDSITVMQFKFNGAGLNPQACIVDTDGTVTPIENSTPLKFVLRFAQDEETGTVAGLPMNAMLSNIEINLSDIKGYNSSTTIQADTVNGNTAGILTGYDIDSGGIIIGKYSNGDTRPLGQVAIARFRNAAGLEKLGDNLYTTTPNSGEFDGVGEESYATGGSISSGFLEMSNVDLSYEFTEMITTQRGFQANSRTITTSDEMLQELVNLKR